MPSRLNLRGEICEESNEIVTRRDCVGSRLDVHPVRIMSAAPSAVLRVHCGTLAHTAIRTLRLVVTRFFHVTSARNRSSIAVHGLDWRRMRDAPGIAGSHGAEQDGCFLCRDEWEVDWFVRMNNTGGAVDVWAVNDVDEKELVESPGGHFYLAGAIPPERLLLVRRDIEPERS